MKYFLSFWKTITRDSFVLRAVKFGITLPFVSRVYQTQLPRKIKMTKEQKCFVDKKVESLLNSRCIVRLPARDPSGFTSSIFLVPKKEKNSFRMILHLKKLNEFLRAPHFRMESLRDVMRLVRSHSWICTCDIQDSYAHFGARVDQQKFLQFSWGGHQFAFSTMPQGLKIAPYCFTRICKQIAKYLRSKGVLCVFYIDDVIVVGNSFSQCQAHVDIVVSTLQNCGFLINWKKSQLIPQQTAMVLGFLIDAPSESISLTPGKQSSLRMTFQAALKKKSVTIKQFARWIGLCISILPCFPLGKMHYSDLEHDKIAALRRRGFKWGKTMEVSDRAKMTLTWWLHVINENKPHAFRPKVISMTMSSDASDFGWGISFDSGERTGFRFSQRDVQLPINSKELLAIYYGILSFKEKIAGHHILIKTDSTTALADMKKMRSMCSVFRNDLVQKVYSVLTEIDTQVSLTFVNGFLNSEADEKSRVFTSITSEWSLPQDIFNNLLEMAPDMSIDLFASHLNAKLPRFCSWTPTPGCCHCDAFTYDWDLFVPFCFPPLACT